MSIDYCFLPPETAVNLDAQKDSLNKSIFELTIAKFDEETTILKKQDIFVLFDSNPDPLINNWGITIIKDTPFHEDSLHRLPYEMAASAARFKIYIHTKVRETDDRIFKVFTFAHELQHVLQYLDSDDNYLRAGVIQAYLQVCTKRTYASYLITPIEVDARRKAKSIATRIHGQKKVGLFIDQQVRNSKDNELDYWTSIRGLDIEKPYDLGEEMGKSWRSYESEVKLKISQLESTSASLGVQENYLLEAFRWLERSDGGRHGTH